LCVVRIVAVTYELFVADFGRVHAVDGDGRADDITDPVL
jgi:hypothetical protein